MIFVTCVFIWHVDLIIAVRISFNVNPLHSVHSGKLLLIIAHISEEAIIGIIPVPFIVDSKNVVIAASTAAKLSPFSIPSPGISIPVYFMHWSEIVQQCLICLCIKEFYPIKYAILIMQDIIL